MVSSDDLAKIKALERAAYAVDGQLSIPLADDYEAALKSAISSVRSKIDEPPQVMQYIFWLTLNDGTLHLRGYVHPDYRGRGTGTTILRTTEAVAYEEQVNTVIIHSEANTPDAHTLYTSNGYEMYFAEEIMKRDFASPLPESNLPDGITLRTWANETAPEFFAVYTDAFSDRPGFHLPEMGEWIEWMSEEETFRPDLSFLAVKNDEAVGYMLSDMHVTWARGGGWISQVGTRIANRGQGIASALINHTMRAMQAEGCAFVGLHVNVNNIGAIYAYRKLGFEIVGRRARYRREFGREGAN